MKIHIINPQNFNPKTLEFYHSFAEEVPFDDADIIVTQLDPVETDKEVVVATNCTGLDHIKAPNAKVISLRGEDLSDFTAVPELCLWAMLELVRHRARQELKGKTLGIIGMGRIGWKLSQYASNLGVVMYAFDKTRRLNLPFVKLNMLLNNSDIVSLHITADEENRNFMDLEKFKMMKNGSWFLNSARPWLVEEEALKWALDNKLAGAWFDFDMPFEHPKLITTSHIGGSTPNSLERSQMLIAKKVAEYSKEKSNTEIK